MIDDTSDAGSWQTALAPDNRSLKFMKPEQLHHPFIIEHIAQWWGCSLEEAQAAKGAELLRRTTTTDYQR